MSKQELLRDTLLKVANGIDTGNSNFTDEECTEYLEILNKATNTQNKLSKYQACKYLKISRATFDNWVRSGKIPKGRKEQGFKELFWTLEDLQNIK